MQLGIFLVLTSFYQYSLPLCLVQCSISIKERHGNNVGTWKDKLVIYFPQIQ